MPLLIVKGHVHELIYPHMLQDVVIVGAKQTYLVVFDVSIRLFLASLLFSLYFGPSPLKHLVDLQTVKCVMLMPEEPLFVREREFSLLLRATP